MILESITRIPPPQGRERQVDLSETKESKFLWWFVIATENTRIFCGFFVSGFVCQSEQSCLFRNLRFNFFFDIFLIFVHYCFVGRNRRAELVSKIT